MAFGKADKTLISRAFASIYAIKTGLSVKEIASSEI
jgi:hypothetical protein